MSIRNLDALFRPGAIAIVGGSRTSDGPVRTVAENLLRAGFDGPVMPVHPDRRALAGVLAYPRVADLPVAPDLGVVATPPEAVAETVAALGERGARAAVVLTAGFGDDGDAASMRRRREILEAARPHTLRVLGPNALGVIAPRHGVNASFATQPPAAGDLALVTQSGAMAMAMLDWARPRGIGFSRIAALGDMADVDLGDCLDDLAYDPRTRAVLMYAEGITHARKFMSAARAAARTKPVIVIKGGRYAEGAHAARRHTGAAAGRDAVYDAAFRRAGMLRVNTLPELFDAAQTLAMAPQVSGERMTIVTNGGGPGVLAADALVDGGGALTRLSDETVEKLDAVLPAGWSRGNPVDIQGDADAERYATALQTVLAQRDGDAVLVINTAGPAADSAGAAAAVVRAMGGRRRPVFAAWLGGDGAPEGHRTFAAHRVPSYNAPEDAVRGFLHLVRYRRSQANLMETPPSLPERFAPDTETAREVIASARAEGATTLDAAATDRLLRAYGLATDPDAAAAPTGIRLAMGAREEPPFGPVLLVGQGGPAWTARHDVAVGLPPLNMVLARRMVGETRVAGLLDADASGEGTSTVDAAAVALIALAQLIAEHPAIAEVDINPMRAGDDGLRIGGARVTLHPADSAIPASGQARLAIRPYPEHLTQRIATSSGLDVVLRPIRPEDEPALQALFRQLDPEDVRLRFFSPMRELSHTFAARLTQIDYEREMALIAVNPADDTDMYGVVRLSCDPDNVEGEYAVMVRSDLKGHGLGYALMQAIIAHGRNRGTRAIVGDVLAENRAMLAMCRELGFRVRASADDPQVMRVRLELAGGSSDAA